MESIEYKKIYSEFVGNIRDILADMEDVDDGDVPDLDDKNKIISQAKSKLEEYEKLLETLDAHFAQDLKNDVDKNMKYLKKLLDDNTI